MITTRYKVFAAQSTFDGNSGENRGPSVSSNGFKPVTPAEKARLDEQSKKPKRERVFRFEDLDESEQKRVSIEIQALTTATEYKNMINLESWCQAKGLLLAKMLTVLRRHGAAVIRLHNAYLTTESSINNVMDKEILRQITLQCQNKATNRRLSQIKKQVQEQALDETPQTDA